MKGSAQKTAIHPQLHTDGVCVCVCLFRRFDEYANFPTKSEEERRGSAEA